MNRIDIENALRPVLQNLNVIGSRGPPKSWVFPAMLAGVLAFVLLVVLLVSAYEFAFTGKCPLCGGKEHESK
jgi:hypothetical protein